MSSLQRRLTGITPNPKFKRHPDDFYREERWADEALLDYRRFAEPVHDPACGVGTIVTACRERGMAATGGDLVDRGFLDPFTAVDFTAPPAPDAYGSVGSVITNPPYRHAEIFIRHALLIARHQVAALVRLAFLEGVTRRETLFAEARPALALVSSRRISMLPGDLDQKPEGGAIAYCWLIWDLDEGPRGRTELDWL